MSLKKSTKEITNRILFFFPFQLVILHVKKNHLLLFFWFLLWGYTGNFLAAKYGVSYLFLYPEYLGTVGFMSFALTGFALGGFVMAFNIYTYIIHAHRFPFLATLAKPFYKFTVNNFIVPTAFTIFYLVRTVYFQYTNELETMPHIMMHICAFLFGLVLFFAISFAYFFNTNKNIESFKTEDLKSPSKGPSFRNKGNWYFNKAGKVSWRVDSYMKNFYSIRVARETKHYDGDLLRKVFYQNHINASIFEVFLILNFLLIGIFSDIDFFVLPGGASILLSFTFLLMVISVVLSWVRGWTLTLMLILGLGFNFLSGSQYFSFSKNVLYGINYSSKASYQEEDINLVDYSVLERDREKHETTLNLWKKNISLDHGKKPKLVIINCSGGGLRSAMWTCQSLAYADSITNGALLEHTVLFSGASGGMLGAAYVRELNYREGDKPWYQDKRQLSTIGDDILNPLLHQLTTFDLLSGLRQFEYNGYSYPRDRAYSFEEHLNKNTNYVFDKTLGDYYTPVKEAKMPMMILSPTIINDGRRMLICSQPISFMTQYEERSMRTEFVNNKENIEFAKIFSGNDAERLRFSSALRANATFPYVLPQVSLPTEPTVVLMDAGMRDNYGYKTSFQYIYAIQNWIENNTSGVIILNVRDKSKHIWKEKERTNSIMDRLLSPLGNLYNNFTRVQDFTHDQMLQDLNSCINQDIEEIYIEMGADKALNVSMSYHLTKKEKIIIKEALLLERNKQAFDRLKNLLEK